MMGSDIRKAAQLLDMFEQLESMPDDDPIAQIQAHIIGPKVDIPQWVYERLDVEIRQLINDFNHQYRLELKEALAQLGVTVSLKEEDE